VTGRKDYQNLNFIRDGGEQWKIKGTPHNLTRMTQPVSPKGWERVAQGRKINQYGKKLGVKNRITTMLAESPFADEVVLEASEKKTGKKKQEKSAIKNSEPPKSVTPSIDDISPAWDPVGGMNKIAVDHNSNDAPSEKSKLLDDSVVRKYSTLMEIEQTDFASFYSFLTTFLCWVFFLAVIAYLICLFVLHGPTKLKENGMSLGFWVTFSVFLLICLFAYMPNHFNTEEKFVQSLRHVMSLKEFDNYLNAIKQGELVLEFNSYLINQKDSLKHHRWFEKHEPKKLKFVKEVYPYASSWDDTPSLSWETFGLVRREQVVKAQENGQLCMIKIEFQAIPNDNETENACVDFRSEFFKKQAMNESSVISDDGDVLVQESNVYFQEKKKPLKNYERILVYIAKGTEQLNPNGPHANEKVFGVSRITYWFYIIFGQGWCYRNYLRRNVIYSPLLKCVKRYASHPISPRRGSWGYE